MLCAENNLVKDLTVVTHIFYLSRKKWFLKSYEYFSVNHIQSADWRIDAMPISYNPLIASRAIHIKALWAFIPHVN